MLPKRGSDAGHKKRMCALPAEERCRVPLKDVVRQAGEASELGPVYQGN